MYGKLKNNNGSVLLYVMILILMLTIVSTTILATATNSAKGSAFSEKYEQTYYNAESAINVAEAIFTSGIIIPESATGQSASEAYQSLLNTLDNNLETFKIAAETELFKIYPDANFYIDYTIDQTAIRTEISHYNSDGVADEYISFFGGDYMYIESLDIFEISSVTPFAFTVYAGVDNRAVEMERSYTISNARFEKASQGGESGEYYVLAGENLINSNSLHTNINLPNGLVLGKDGLTHNGGIDFPSKTLDLSMINISDEIGKVKNKINDIDLDILEIKDGSYTITPDSLLKPNGSGYYNAVRLKGWGTLTFAGDFSKTKLRMIYSEQYIHLGTNNNSFICDRSNEDYPLYVYAKLDSRPMVNFAKGGTIKNAVITCENVIYVEGNTVDDIHCDAIFYNTNTIVINIIAKNWDIEYVPSFISSNSPTVNVKAENGFSSIFYCKNWVANFSIDAPYYNGALLVAGASVNNTTLKNSITGEPMQMYCEINIDAYNNLPQKLREYFDDITSKVGSGGFISGDDAKYITTDEYGNTIRNEIKNTSTIREVDIKP